MPVSISIWRAQIGSFLGQMISQYQDKLKFNKILHHCLFRILLMLFQICSVLNFYIFDIFDEFVFKVGTIFFSKLLRKIVKGLIEYQATLMYLGYIILFLKTLLILSGDIEQNPGQLESYLHIH